MHGSFLKEMSPLAPNFFCYRQLLISISEFSELFDNFV